jgi:hypothetical protein
MHGARVTSRHHVQAPDPLLERGSVGERGLGDVRDRFPGEEPLVAGDEDVREGEEPAKTSF